MNTEKKIARKIVANLARRYRKAKSRANKEFMKDRLKLWTIYDSIEMEAWNAYVASRMMLYGDDQE